MQEAFDDDFVFVSVVNNAGDTCYRYLNPDGRELLITHAPEKR